MAQGHLAYRISKAIPETPFKISVIACSGNKLLLGDTDGKLHQYDDENSAREYRLTRECDVSHRRIAQIECAPEVNLALVLSGTVIHLVALDSLQVVGQLTEAGTAVLTPTSLITLARHGGSLSVCAAVEKNLVVLECTAAGQFSVMHQVSIPERVTAMVQLPFSLCLGSKRGYSIANLQSREFDMLFETGSSQVPLIAEADEELMLLRDCVGICVNSEGKPTRKSAIQWTSMPSHILFDSPHLLGLLQNGIEVQSLDAASKEPLQSIPLRHACAIAAHPDSSIVCAASPTEVFLLAAVPLPEQVAQLLQANRFEAAIALTAHLDPKVASQERRRVYGLSACDLFVQGNFKAAFRHFGKSDANPLSVVALVPDLLPPYVPQPPPPCSVAMPALVKSLHKQAMRCAVEFLEEFRTQHTSTSSGEVASVLDTVLLKALLVLGKEDMALQLLRSPNHCHLEESARLLEMQGLHSGLILLYTAHSMHARALEILGSRPQEPPHSQVMAYLKEHMSTLERALVFELMAPIIKEQPEAGLKVFTSGKAGPDRIGTAEVLSFLEEHSPELRVQYLEGVIRNEDIKEISPQHHNHLALLYLNSVVTHRDYSKTKDLPTKLAVAKEAGSVGRRRKKLILFLEHQPRCYQPEVLLEAFPTGELFQERAILLRAVGAHREALSIYVHQLHDHKLAERYCLCLHDKEEHSDIFLQLLRVYLEPPEGVAPNLKAALALMNGHHHRMDPVAALEMLPEREISVATLQSFLNAAVRHNVEHRRSVQVQRHLMVAERMQLAAHLTRLKQQHVTVPTGLRCVVCGEPLLAGQAPMISPDKTVMHHSCSPVLDKST